MIREGGVDTARCEQALAEGIMDVASELRLIDAVDLIAFIRTEQFGNIRNLVSSSTELFFKPGTVNFGASGEVDMRWGKPPAIMLDMEFQHKQVRVYFRLLLEALRAGVEIDYVSFDDGSDDLEKNTKYLIDAITDARLKPVQCAPKPVGIDL